MNLLAEGPSLQVNKHKDAKVCWKQHEILVMSVGIQRLTLWRADLLERVRPSNAQFEQTTLITSDVVEKESGPSCSKGG